MSMAAGEYVSVSSQADTENADLERERQELATEPEREHAEMAAIYVKRGLDAPLAAQVATQLMSHDALGTHARDELGISEIMSARPLQAAWTSAATIPRGVRAGQHIRLVGQGMPGAGQGKAGDLYLEISFHPHALWRLLQGGSGAHAWLRPQRRSAL
jgi:curved DNA-binding protein CbpA